MMLGSIYRDMDNGPKAVRCYLEAIELADTTGNDCDYRTLFGIYGQLAGLYKEYSSPRESLKEFEKYILYSEKAGDTVSACFGHEAMIYLHYALGDTVSALSKVEDCRNRYLEHGMHEEAAGVYPVLIYVCIERGQFSKARYYMDIYERESGLFDSSNNILAGREHYYKIRGMYSLGVGDVDSAEYYYRKLGNYNYGYESAQGLLKVYSVKNDNDSVSKYTRLCEAEMDSILTKKKASELIQASSSHTFDRIKTKANKSRKILTVIALLCAVVAVVLVFYGRRLFRKYKSRIANLDNSLSETEEAYRQISNSHKKAICEVDKLRSQLDYSNEEHKKEIYDLTFKKEQLSASLYKLDINASMEDFKKSHIYLVLKERTRIVPKNNNSQDINWVSFRKEFSCHFPLLYTTLTENKKLSHQEFKVCALLWLGFENKEIANLINCKAQVVSNAKASANEKLFSDKSAKTLLGNMQNTAVAITGAQQKQEVTGTII